MTTKNIVSKENIIKNIRTELKKSATEKYKNSFQRFFKEKVKFYGVSSTELTVISKKYWQLVKLMPKKDIFLLCETLYSSDYCEEAFIVSSWTAKLKDQYTKNDFVTFQKWIHNYINNWAKCDGFCNHTMGSFIEKYPEYLKKLKKWSKSKNIWVKRASAVSLIVPARNGRYLDDVFEISESLLSDENHMVQKGYGWLLKEASRIHEKDVLEFVLKHKKEMPRTALRYAIELMPKNLKTVAMKK